MKMSKEQEERLALAAAAFNEKVVEMAKQLSELGRQEALIEQRKNDWPHNRREAFGRVAK